MDAKQLVGGKMANDQRLIDANALKDEFRRYMAEKYDRERCGSEESCITCGRVCSFQRTVNNAPTVDAVVLPCKIGKTVYVITYCRCGRPECYEKKHCYKKETAKTPKVLARKMVQQLGWKTVWNMFGGIDKQKSGWQPKGTICYRVYQKPFELKMLTEVGKTVFLTLEDAEQALAEREQN